jgi:hypothetical protein
VSGYETPIPRVRLLPQAELAAQARFRQSEDSGRYTSEKSAISAVGANMKRLLTATSDIGGRRLAAAVLACGCRHAPPPSESGSPASGQAASGGDFEGVIQMTMTLPQGKADATYYLKPGHARIETKLPQVPGSETVMLWDIPTGKMTALMVTQKLYRTVDMSDATSGAGNNQPAPPKLTDTGKQETVAGYPCEHWLVGASQDMDIDMCIAKGLGSFGGGPMGQGPLGNLFSKKSGPDLASNPELAKLIEGGAFPLKTSMSSNGKTSFSMEATSINRQKVDDSKFSVPADYKEFKIPSLPGGGAGKP